MERTWVEVSQSALRKNAQILGKLVSKGTKIAAVVKANAYGHGLLGTAKALAKEIDVLAVFNVEDALAIRKSKISTEILVLGITDPTQFQKLAGKNISIVLANADYLPFIPPRLGVHLKIDTGLSRQGILPEDVASFCGKIPSHVRITGVCSHFADADNISDRSFTLGQISRFDKAIATLSEAGIAPLVRHIAATDGFFQYPEAEYDMVRLGIAVYGIPPSPEFMQKFTHLGLVPALTWKTRITQLKNITKKATVGYGRTFAAERNMRLAILPIGYWDGYARSLSSRGIVSIGGTTCNVVGRISMNVIIVDVSTLEDLRVGDEVELIGPHVSALDLAQRAGTISHEIISRINPEIKRIYVP